MRLQSVKAKLILLGATTTVVAVAAMAVGTGTVDRRRIRRDLRARLELQAAIVAHGTTAALAFGDAGAAAEALGALRASPEVLQAAAYGGDGAVLAEYRRDTRVAEAAPPAPASVPVEGAVVARGEASVFRPVILDGERIGTVYVRASTASADAQARTAALSGLAIALASLGAAAIVALRLQRRLTDPVLALTETVEAVAATGDHARRVRVDSDDELGVLARGLNGMLAALEERDAALALHQRTLEDTVAERTAQLAEANRRLEAELRERQRLHDQLTHAQKMEAIGRLAGGVAHDFNNVLAVIQLCAAELVDSLPEGEQRGAARDVADAADRAARLTRQLLAFSRKETVKPVVLDAGVVVAEISKMIARLVGEQIELGVRVGPGLGNVFMDPSQLEQVLVNLAVNARDAMPDGGRLDIDARDVVLAADEVPGLAAGRYVRLRVSDTGIGMDAETRARVFEPFFTTKAKGHGTGLGLAIAYGAVERAGGRLTVESSVGRGTTFAIHLPRTERERAAPERVDDAPAGRGERLLLVEDDPRLRDAVARILQIAG